MTAHDRFETLAGAVLLGEASSEERATFDAHAQACSQCRDDAADGGLVRARVTLARQSERWRPSQPIVEKLRARRSVRARFTLGALGWAVALSLVLNVAFVSGVGARLGAAFLSVGAPEGDIASTPISLESARHVAVAPTHLTRRHSAHLATRAPHVALRVRKATIAAAPREHAATFHEPTIEDVPDLLAGVDLYGDGGAHRAVAHVSLPRCLPHSDAAPGVRPCRDAEGRVVER